MNDPTHYQRNLPHRLPLGETLFITFRLTGTLPQIVVERLRAELAQALAASSPAPAEAEQTSYAY